MLKSAFEMLKGVKELNRRQNDITQHYFGFRIGGKLKSRKYKKRKSRKSRKSRK